MLLEVCDSVLDPSDPRYDTEEYRKYVEVLEWKLRKITITDSSHTKLDATSLKVTELYQLAILVYLERTSRNFSGQSAKLSKMVSRAFDIFSELETCQWPFPLMIFGCEARSDEHRMLILELISKTERDAHVRSLGCVNNMVRFVWTQDDLAVEQLDYVDKMSTILSTSDTVPTFV